MCSYFSVSYRYKHARFDLVSEDTLLRLAEAVEAVFP